MASNVINKPPKFKKARITKKCRSRKRYKVRGISVSGVAKRIQQRGRKIGRRRTLNSIDRRFKIYDYAISYLENKQRIPELDNFIDLREGDLIRSKENIIGQITKPAKRSRMNPEYRKKVITVIPEDTVFMFLERHKKFPEYYKFAPIGKMPVWINIADNLLSFNMYKRKNQSKNKRKTDITNANLTSDVK